MFKKIRNLFLTGILVILPLIGSLYIIYLLFSVIDSVTGPVIELIIGREIPGVGFILAFLAIIMVGLLATNIIGKKIIGYGENILLKIPLFRNIYVSIKRVLDALFTQNKNSFKTPVLFEYPRKGLYQIGFITKDSSPYFDSLVEQELYNVFLPTTPNPTSGMFIMVPKNDAVILDLSIEDALKLIISGGILEPDFIPTIREQGEVI